MTLRVVDAPSPNSNERRHPVDMLVLHYTGMADGPSALARLRDPGSEVSAHYLVEEDGTVFALVPERKRAWHAGRSWWRGDDDLNSRSIGIEIVNGGHDYGLPPFPDVQIEAVTELAQGILSRWAIPQNRIVAHSDIAPDRKEDPGERFPWKRLADAGIGLWPESSGDDRVAPVGLRPGDRGEQVAALQRALANIGYRIEVTDRFDVATETVVRAFQRRWRPASVTGQGDLATVLLINAVAKLAAPPIR
ncbi:MAG: N-acetylmuramoyl-L-alanine amidase [Alphaproteobacteria bacterium]|nr:N-acetylmuramoyl-L-alanine amidase [Alphaproteobacteria bacterium]